MRHHSIAGPIILIVVGVLFLLSNLGMLAGLGPLFTTWWPLILIVLGAVALMRRTSYQDRKTE
jgi:hypothetical protein